MKKDYQMLFDGGTPIIPTEEREAIINEAKDKAKAELVAEAKTDMESINKLIADERKKHEDMLKGLYTEADFKQFQANQKVEEDKLRARVDAIETQMKRPDLGNPGDTKEQRPEVKAFWKWMRKGEQALAAEEFKLMQIANDPSAGYIAPIELSSRIIQRLNELSKLRPIITVETIGGSSLEMVAEGSDTVTAAWPDETLAAGDYKFKMEKFEPHELRVLVTPKKTLLEDNMFDLEGYIVRKTAEKINMKEGEGLISGDGVERYEGILSHPSVAEVKSGDANNLTPDGLISLAYDLSSLYETNARFLMRRATVGKIRLFKEATSGRYIWEPNYQAGQPSTLLGYPIVEDPYAPAVAADAYPVFFGDFKQAITVVDRIQLEVQRLVEKYALEGLIGFLFRKRTDGMVVLAEALRKHKVAA